MEQYTEYLVNPDLTDDMRAYLRTNARTDVLLYDFVRDFMRQFQLDPLRAGKLVGQWIVETM